MDIIHNSITLVAGDGDTTLRAEFHTVGNLPQSLDALAINGDRVAEVAELSCEVIERLGMMIAEARKIESKRIYPYGEHSARCCMEHGYYARDQYQCPICHPPEPAEDEVAELTVEEEDKALEPFDG